ncbi:Small-conductance mechanosensitive channel [Rubripirellula obstinata]|uniref:Small-conductance mechanosensitive channel n=1 Tax=Rubripirellula obstinata TaxID=406547 RepID=A0A5B1CPD3_9BACT|nr:mechanosensitive ion channel domain-containing protein [Rubripirellula obstinata]KAA1261470.1 Small-conductance mechanosensitive channel [Rubripirellula obstinata]
MRHFIVLFLLLATPLHAQDTNDSAPATDTNTPAETIAVDDVADDSAIRDRLKKIYGAAKNAGWLTDTDVVLDSGIVTLQGQADTDEHRQWAENVARKTEDVVAVINELTIKSEVDLESTRQVVTKSLDSLWTDFLIRSPLLIAAFVLLALTSILAKAIGWLVHRLLDKRGMRTSLKDLIYQLTSIAIWIAGLLVATVVAFPGMTPSKALTVLGLGSVAIGFAFKDIFENFFAGILILWRYPFDRGDFITCSDLTGEVREITIRNTLIRKLDGELAVVPNATLFKNNVDVLTSQPQRRVRIICGVAYDEDVDQSREVIREAVQSCESVQGKRTVEVFANEFASSSVNFEVAWWTGSKPTDIRRSRDEVVGAIKRHLDEAGIEIPFPYRTLTFKNPSDEQVFQSVQEKSKGT